MTVKMKSNWTLAVAFLGAAIVGCSTIQNAREAQAEVSDKSCDDYIEPSSKLDLRGYSLSQLIDFAITNRPSVASAALAVEDARLALKAIAADAPLLSETPWTAPKLSLSGSYSESSRGTSFSKADFSTHSGSPSSALSLDLLIWDFGRHDANVAAQTEAILAAELKLIDHGYDVFYEVSDAYFSLLEKGALMEVAYTNEAMYAEHLEQAERRYQAGDQKELDVLRAKLDHAQACEKTQNAIKDVRVAGVKLMQALGVDASQGTREEIMDFSENALSFVLRGFPDTDYTVAEAFELSRTNAPMVRLARAKIRQASAEVDYAIADLKPNVSMSASLSWVDPLWYFNWGASFAQSIFQGFRKTTAIDRAVVALEQASADLDTTEQELSVSLEEAITVRDNANIARFTARKSLTTAEENLRLVERQYEVGDVSRVDFTDSVADYVSAMGNAIKAFYDGQRAECAIFSLIGVYPVFEEMKIKEELMK